MAEWGRIRGRYELLERIGAGAMGSVYRARHAFTGEIGALKLLHAQRASDERSVRRFLREARTVSLARSPHIVQVKDAGGLSSGRPFIFMELLRGFTLKRALDHAKTLTPALAVEFALQAAKGLEAAHQAGIVHRDIKPDNLFLVVDGGSGLPVLKLLDFGISKLDVAFDQQTALTRQGVPLGTPGYMAPEQFYDSANVDRRADVYALGVVIHQCLTGRLPFVAATLRQQCEAAHKADLPPLEELPCEVGPALHAVLDKALRARPGERYAGCLAFAKALFDVAGSVSHAREDWDRLGLCELAAGEANAAGDLVDCSDARVGSTSGGELAGAGLSVAQESHSDSPDATTIVPWVSWEDLPPLQRDAEAAERVRTDEASPLALRAWLIGARDGLVARRRGGALVGLLVLAALVSGTDVWERRSTTSARSALRPSIRDSSLSAKGQNLKERGHASGQAAAESAPKSARGLTSTAASRRITAPSLMHPARRTTAPTPGSVSGAPAPVLEEPSRLAAPVGQELAAGAADPASDEGAGVVEGKFGTRFVRDFE